MEWLNQSVFGFFRPPRGEIMRSTVNRQYSGSGLIVLFLFALLAPWQIYCQTRFETIENFDSGIVNLSSWADEDLAPDSWVLDTVTTHEGSPFALKLFGNTWKQQFISPLLIDSLDVLQLAARTASNPRIQGIGFSDGTHTLFYSLAGSAILNIEQWVTVYQGAFSSGTWNTYQLPIADDWYAYFDYLPVLSSIIYVNDLDSGGNYNIWFDSIIDISADLPIAPEVEISINVSSNTRIDEHQRQVGIQFSSTVEDPDSSVFTYQWDCGDTGTSNQANPYHLYTVMDNHPYRASLIVTDQTNRWGTASVLIDVDAGTGSLPLSFNFVGDIMLARRYEQPGGIIPTQGIAAIFAPTQNLLGNAADVTVANLEVVLTNQGNPHPSKSVVYRGNPSNVNALPAAGIDVVSLANNHTLDYGLEGLQQMQGNLANLGMIYSGAGANSYEAYKPAWVKRKGLSIAMLRACDRTGQYNNSEPYLNAGYNKYGFAYMSPYYFQQQVDAVSENADLIIAELHGGSEYSLAPGSGYDKNNAFLDDTEDEEYDYRTDVPHMWDIAMRHQAIDSGADLVVVHHPHILHGLEIYNGKLIAHSLGNFVFDLTYPETFPTMILYADADLDGFSNYRVKPVYIDAYIPKPATGQLGLYILDYVAMRSRELNTVLLVDKENVEGSVLVNPAEAEVYVSHNNMQQNLTMSNNPWHLTDPFKLPRNGSISGISAVNPVEDAQVRLGAETIWFGNFENEGSSLWDVPAYNTTDVLDGARSAQLSPATGQTQTATIKERCKWYDNTKTYTLHGWIKTRNLSQSNIIIRYYNTRTGSQIGSQNVTTTVFGTTEWSWFQQELTIPSNAWYYDIRLTATGNGASAMALFDNVGLIEWSPWQNAAVLQSVNFPNNYYWAQIQTTEHPKSIAFNFTESSYLPAPERGSGGYAPVVKQLKIFPNPLVNESNIRFELLTADQTKIEVFNLRGQKVRSLVDSALPKGQQSFKWDGRDDRNRKLASGIYFIKIAQGKRSNTAKMLLLK